MPAIHQRLPSRSAFLLLQKLLSALRLGLCRQRCVFAGNEVFQKSSGFSCTCLTDTKVFHGIRSLYRVRRERPNGSGSSAGQEGDEGITAFLAHGTVGWGQR